MTKLFPDQGTPQYPAPGRGRLRPSSEVGAAPHRRLCRAALLQHSSPNPLLRTSHASAGQLRPPPRVVPSHARPASVVPGHAQSCLAATWTPSSILPKGSSAVASGQLAPPKRQGHLPGVPVDASPLGPPSAQIFFFFFFPSLYTCNVVLSTPKSLSKIHFFNIFFDFSLTNRRHTIEN